MKIVMVTPDFPLSKGAVVGGVQGVCFYLVQALRRIENVEVEVVVLNTQLRGVMRSCERTVDGIKIHALVAKGNVPFYVKLLWQMPRLLDRKLAQMNRDITHFQGMASWAARADCASVLTIHGINERDTLFRGRPFMARLRSWGNAMSEGRARRRVPNVIAINPYIQSFLNQGGGQRVWDIPNPVANSFFDIPWHPQPGRIFSAATITARKNQLNLIRGFARVINDYPEAELRLAGSGARSPYGQQCQDVAHELRIADRVHCLGSLSIQQIQNELGQAQCLALTSYQETAPVSISEAMAAGVPVVAANVCGIPWMVEEGITGRLVDPADPDDIARGLRQVLREDNVKEMSAAAKCSAEQRYRASVVASRTVEVYREILATVTPCGS